MRFLKTFAAVVLVCFTFTLNGLGQNVEVRNTEIYVNDTLYAYLEECPAPNLGFPFTIPMLKGEQKFLNKLPNYRFLSSNRSLLGYIVPARSLPKSERKLPYPYTILFNPTDQREHLYYGHVESIKNKLIEDLVNFELISNNKLDKPALRRLFENYGQDIMKSSAKFIQPCPDMGKIRIYIRQINNEEKTIMGCCPFSAKYNIISKQNDSIIKEVDFFDEFDNYKGRATFLNFAGKQNGYQTLDYKFTSNKQEEKILTIDEYPSDIFLEPGSIFTKDKIHLQLLHLGEYLQYNYYL